MPFHVRPGKYQGKAASFYTHLSEATQRAVHGCRRLWAAVKQSNPIKQTSSIRRDMSENAAVRLQVMQHVQKGEEELNMDEVGADEAASSVCRTAAKTGKNTSVTTSFRFNTFLLPCILTLKA